MNPGLRTPRSISILVFLVGLALVLAPAHSSAQDIVYEQDFESGSGGWGADNGLWQVGEATEGPVGSGNVAGTVLDGNYAYLVGSRFMSPWIDLEGDPEVEDRFWLRFRIWFHLNAEDGVDYGRVQILVDEEGSQWTNISGQFTAYSSYWTECMLDLTEHANRRVKIGFLIQDVDASYPGGHQESLGIYIDDVTILKGVFPTRWLHTFDDSNWLDWEGWHASNGCWQIGTPQHGCTTTRSGQFCAGTGLEQNYSFRANSRLVSPEFDLPSAPADGQIWLTFWSWHAMNNADGWDYGEVQVMADGGDWETVQTGFQCYARCWSPCAIDLSAYAGQIIRVAFRFVDTDNSYPGGHQENCGWFIDDVAIREGRRWLNNPESCRGTISGWSSLTGTWQMGVPTTGPGSGFDDDTCWGTNLEGNYGYRVTAVLESTPISLPPGDSVVFQFQQWFSFNNTDGSDYGEVRVVCDGEQTVVMGPITGSSAGQWSPGIVDLAPWTGQTIQLRFRLVDVDSSYPGGHIESSGWFLDDFEFIGLPASSPPPPQYSWVTYSSGPPVVNWVPDPSAAGVCIYACRDIDAIPELGNRVAVLPAGSTSFQDLEHPGYRYFYHVAFLDELDHESCPHMNPAAVGGSSGVPSRLATLHGAQPNPFNPATEVKFTLLQAADVLLQVYDLTGRRVETLVAEKRPAGTYSMTYRPDRLASGAYILRLRAGQEVQTTKLMLVR